MTGSASLVCLACGNGMETNARSVSASQRVSVSDVADLAGKLVAKLCRGSTAFIVAGPEKDQTEGSDHQQKG
jgi:hypothetical protein